MRASRSFVCLQNGFKIEFSQPHRLTGVFCHTPTHISYIQTAQHKPWYTFKLPNWLWFFLLFFFSFSNCPFFFYPISSFFSLIRYFQIFKLPHHTVIWSIVPPSTPSPSVFYLSPFSALFHNKMRLWMDLQSGGLQAKLQSYNHSAINAGMAKTINSKQGKQVCGTALAWSITDNYTHGLACLCGSVCTVCLQQASVTVFTIMARNMLNGSMWDKLELLLSLLHTHLCLSLTHTDRGYQSFMSENLVSRLLSVNLTWNCFHCQLIK